MNKKEFPERKAPHELLREWVTEEEMSVADFARQMGYSYTHALLICNGTRNIEDAVVGRLLIVYGPEGPAWLVAQALVAARTAAAQPAAQPVYIPRARHRNGKGK